MPAADLLPNPKNWRTHPKAQQDAMRGVLADIGYAGAALARETDDGLMLIDGHLRAEVSTEAEVPVLILDVTEEEADKILATFDPISSMAGTDEDKLRGLLDAVDIDNAAVNDLLDGMAAELPQAEVEIVEDEVPEVPDDPITQPGDLWTLGRHRLLCGDSTMAEDVGRLMDGETAVLVHADPPYGVNYQANWRAKSEKFAVLENDDTVLTEWVEPARESSQGFVFVWTSWKCLSEWMPVVSEFGTVTNMVIWSKGGGGIGDLKKTFSTDFEICLVCNRGSLLAGKRIGSVWSFGKDAASQYLHPTQKPVSLVAQAIQSTTGKSALILDPFVGSGTTLIAAEQLDRRCYGLELSPAYCDVIVQRWETLTGEKAVRFGE